MKELAKLLGALFAPAERDDPFPKFLCEGNDVTHRDVKVVLDERGVPFKWSRYECLHCDEISLSYRDGHYLLSGRGRFEMDDWSCTRVGMAFIPGRIRVVIEFLRGEWQKIRHA